MSQLVTRSKKRPQKQTRIRRMEAAGPSGEKLRQLVKRHPAPQQWYDEENGPGEMRRA